MPFLLIHSARQLLTVRGSSGPRCGPDLNSLHIIEDGAVLIEGDRIREVGPTRRIENLAQARSAREISAIGRVVMPGFIDCHTHLISGIPPLDLGDWPEIPIVRSASAALEAVAHVRDATAKRLASEASRFLHKCAAYGTTTLEAKSGYALNAGGEIKMLRTLQRLSADRVEIVPNFFGAHVVPAEFEGRPGAYLRFLTEDVLPVLRQRRLTGFVSGCADPGAFGASDLRPYLQRARELGFHLKLHYAQFGPSDGLNLASHFRFITVDHCDHAPPGQLSKLASSSIAVLTPAASFFMDRRPPFARELIDAGVAVALGSNFGLTATPACNMQFVIFLATHQMGMTPAESIVAATINAAHALRLGTRTGSIEPGKQADLAILNVGDYREIAYQFGANLVGVTIKRGVVVSDNNSTSKWQSRL